MSYQLDSGIFTPNSVTDLTTPTHNLYNEKRMMNNTISPSNQNTENLNMLNLQSQSTNNAFTLPSWSTQYPTQQCSPNMKRAANILSGSIDSKLINNQQNHNNHNKPVIHPNTITNLPQQQVLTPRRDHSAPTQLAVYNSIMSPMSMLMAGSDYLNTDKKNDVSDNTGRLSSSMMRHSDSDSVTNNTNATSTTQLPHSSISPPLHTTTLQPFNYLRSSSAPTYDTINTENDNGIHQQYNSNLQHVTPATIVRTPHDPYNNINQTYNTIHPHTPPLHNGGMIQLNSDTPNLPLQQTSHVYSHSPITSYNTGQSYVNNQSLHLHHSNNNTINNNRENNSIMAYIGGTLSSSSASASDDTPYILTNDLKNKFGCIDCDKVFPSKSSLHMHTLTHTGDKPFHCTYHDCNKSFRQKGHLVSHYRRHTGEKPFECNVCHNQFKDKSGLNTHIRKHHCHDINAMKQLDNNNNEHIITTKYTKTKHGRKSSSSTTSDSDSRSNSTSPNRSMKHNHNKHMNQQHPVQSSQPPPIHQHPIQPQYHNKPNLYNPMTLPQPQSLPTYRSTSYTISTPTPTPDLMSMSSSISLHDPLTSQYLHTAHNGAISPQSAGMLLTSPVFHTQHQLSEPYTQF